MLSPAGEQSAALNPLVHGAVEHDGAAGGAAVRVRLGCARPPAWRVSARAGGGVRSTRVEVAVADPHQALPASWRLRCASSFSRKPAMTPAR